MVRLSVAIPTYGREGVLLDTVAALLALTPPPEELLLLDQTPSHAPATTQQLTRWAEQGLVDWIRLPAPSIPKAMNQALLRARGERVLFLDDDIRPDPQLLSAHLEAGEAWPEVLIAGRVLQPWHGGKPDPADADSFRFNSLIPRPCSQFMGGNFTLPRAGALSIGGFDENFVRVAYRFEAEFSHRWRQRGCSIRYLPQALIEHLQAPHGGTRSFGRHLTTIRPVHAVGGHYFRLRTQPFPAALMGCLADGFKAVMTRHHLRHPWWIPPGLVAQGRSFAWALRLHGRGPSLLQPMESPDHEISRP
ncbi:MAG: glycosyltransferase [Cyanobacteria bacterium J06638_7]